MALATALDQPHGVSHGSRQQRSPTPPQSYARIGGSYNNGPTRYYLPRDL